MKSTIVHFQIQIYSYQGGFSPLATHDEEKLVQGERLAVVLPARKVDPMQVYTFAESGSKESISVRKKALVKVGKKITLGFEREQFMTANQEVLAKALVVRS